MKLARTYNGTGAAVYLCVGFIPDEVRILALEDGDLAEAFWRRSMRAAECDNGITVVTGTTYRQYAALTATTGVEIYRGGDLMTSTNQTSVAYGEGVYLKLDTIGDYKDNLSYGGTEAITSWTLDTLANRTGKFNADTLASGVTRIGEGSRITIQQNDGKIVEAIIEALTAGQGISDNEVTLNIAVSSGTVLKITGMYDMIPIPIGEIAPAGVKVNNTTLINVDNEIQEVTFEKYDDIV